MNTLTQTELEFVKGILLNTLSSYENSLRYDESYVENEFRRNKAKKTQLIEDTIPSKKRTIAELNSILYKL
jgi:hypothetical protein